MTTTTQGSNDPDAIRRDIERTRGRLSHDVDTLTEKVSPGRVVSRRVDRVKSSVSGIKDKVMGSGPGDPSSPGVTDRMSSAASDVTSAAADLPDQARSRAQGNPLAAGMVAFGLGWLASSLLPATPVERQAAEAAKEKAQEHADTLKAPLVEAAQGAKENLQGPAQDAAASLRATAQEGVQEVKQEAGSAKDDVTEQARQSKDAVQDPDGASSVDVRTSSVGSGTTY